MAASNSKSIRWEVSPDGIDDEERAWWQEFADLQDGLAWVQTPEIRQILRSDYIQEILNQIAPSSTVVEFGCGTGWLLRSLARRGASHLIGLDFSERQISIAKKQDLEENLEGRISYYLPTETPENLTADVVICHGFLHHLTNSELREVFQHASAMLPLGGALLLLEPVNGEKNPGFWTLPEKLSLVFGGWKGLRPMSVEEKETRKHLKKMLGSPRVEGRGPSPKEMPFIPGELEQLAAPWFQRQSVRPAMFFGWTVAARLLLLGMTYPRLFQLVSNPTLRFVAAWERFAFKFSSPELWRGWTFCLFQFTKK